MEPLTREQARLVDKVAIGQWNVPGVLLMENAGRGVADVLCETGIDGPVIVACAKGNNGGDGFVIARHLHLRGYAVEVLLLCDPDEIAGDAKVNFDLLKKTTIPVYSWTATDLPELQVKLRQANWLVDALLGTGATGPPREPIATAVVQLNACSGQRLAVDVPTGLDAQTGEASQPTIKADVTCTFVGEKVGFKNAEAKNYLGKVRVLDIGLPDELVREAIDNGESVDS